MSGQSREIRRQIAKTVACPKCGADPGAPCIRKNGDDAISVHRERHKLSGSAGKAWAAKKATQKPGRSPISKRVRFEIFKRDGFRCAYCGAHPPSVVLHVDHIHPVAEGGGNDPDNLVTACEGCNLGKGARPLSAGEKSWGRKTNEL